MAATHGIGLIVNTSNPGDKSEVLARFNALTALLDGREPELDAAGTTISYGLFVLRSIITPTETAVFVALPNDLPATVRAEIEAAINAIPTARSVPYSDLLAADVATMMTRLRQFMGQQGCSFVWMLSLGDSMAGGLLPHFEPI